MMGRRVHGRPSAGFTLAEMLVGLTLVGLIFMMVFGGLRFGTRSWDAVSDASRERDRIVATQAFLRARIAERAVSNPLQLAGGTAPSGLFGERDRLEFFAPWLTNLSVGGIYRFSVRVENNDGDGQLLLSWRPALDGLHGGDLGEVAGERVLLDGIENFQVSYFGGVEGEDVKSWGQEWPEGVAPPELVRVEIGFSDPGREWPPLIIRPGQ